MSAVRKLELAPDEEFLQQALRDGRATRQDVSMRAIGTPDVALQARELHLDLDHCRRLERAKEATGSLAPIVLFRQAKKSTLYLADGHHRHHVYKNLKCAAIPAYVIDSDDAAQEALEFATMCNREMCLGRKPEDIHRAVNMIFGSEKWWLRSDLAISEHVGCSRQLVLKLRAAFAAESSREIPLVIEKSDGRQMKRRTVGQSSAGNVFHRVGNSKNGGVISIKGKKTYFANEGLARSAVRELEQAKREKTYKLSGDAPLQFLASAGFIGAFDRNRSYPGVSAMRRGNVCVCPCDWSGQEFVKAVASLIGARASAGTECRMVVMCYREHGRESLVELYEKAGIEFMTPEELIASLKETAK